jgi:7-cyano-7-deazaguanine synthase
MKKKVVVLVSGGMDSVSALYDANMTHQVVGALSFDYGSKHNHKEIPLADFHCQRLGIPHRVIQLDFVGNFLSRTSSNLAAQSQTATTKSQP